MEHSIYLALGSNLGERAANLQRAVHALPPDVQPLQVSAVYETPPWGYEQQPAFLNAALHAQTDLSPQQVLALIKDLELQLGRLPSFRYGPRLIDIDLLFYDQLVLHSPDLVIPHARLHERAFVLAPLADLAPDLLHPLLHQTVRQLLGQVDCTGLVKVGEQLSSRVEAA